VQNYTLANCLQQMLLMRKTCDWIVHRQWSYCQKSWMKPEAQAAIFSPSLKIVPAITAGSNVLPLSFRQ
jgi:hypothetical protein